MSSQYIIGIDLGTTNSSLSYVAGTSTDPHRHPPVETFGIVQLTNPGELRDAPLLPSFLLSPLPSDFPEGTLALPWDQHPRFVVGALAHKRGAETSGRLVASAKSWLSYSAVDRSAALLPLQAAEGVAKVSPVEASRQYLQHLRHAWNLRNPDALLENQTVLVTVPASFDAVARDLTLRAAQEAGLGDVILLEEPQAAFYAWLERHPDWRNQVKVGDLILVIDIGGGTTDFTLIAVTEEGGELRLERVAVGEHILLGGDNMDLALARFVEHQLATTRGVKLDPMQFQALWQQSRIAKEKLLAREDDQPEQPVTILGRGAGLVGGTIKAKLAAEDLDRILRDGFFPMVSSDEMPQRSRRTALQEIGLPYAADAAVTRHMARFLRQQATTAEGGAIRRTPSGLAAPTHILFNGGVLRAAPVRERLMQVLNNWLQAEGLAAAEVLSGEDLMHAVSRGAAYFGLAREGKGIRIRGGVPRTYYVGIESAMPAIPGMPSPLKALTVAPFGMEEGSNASFPDREFGLIVGEPAEFRFFTSAARKEDPAGLLLEEVGDDLEELAPMEVSLPVENGATGFVPVTLETLVTETGVLQLWCVARDGRRWKLEFNVRESVR